MSTDNAEQQDSRDASLFESEANTGQEEDKVSGEGQLPLFDASRTGESALEEPSHKTEDEQGAAVAAAVLLAVSSLNGIGFKTAQHLFDAGLFHAYRDWETNRVKQVLAETFGRSSQREHLDWIAENRGEVVGRGQEAASDLAKQGIRLIMKNEPEYPARLCRLEDPPRWLFVRGNVGTLSSESMVAMIGTRKPSDYGELIAERCASALARNNFVVLSGLAKGIDSAAHWGAVHCFAQSVAVLGHGINTGLAKHQERLAGALLRDDGAIVSEYLPTDPPSRSGYLRRNELVAALARVVIPVECPSLQSGTGATIRRAQRIGTPVVGVVPASKKMEPLVRTKENLLELGLRVFEFTASGHSMDAFWKYFQTEYPGHNWTGHSERQDRFFDEIERQVLRREHDLSLKPDDVDRLAERLKRNLRSS